MPAKEQRAIIRIQFLKFSIVGTIGFVVDAASLYLFLFAAGLGPFSGRVLSYLIAATTTWVLNRTFTFRGLSSGRASSQWARFVAVNACGGTINYCVYAVLILIGAPFTEHPVIAVAAGSLAGLSFNFMASRMLVFRALPVQGKLFSQKCDPS